MIRFTVLGTPVTQGSKRAFVNQHTGRAVIVESAKGHKSWREAVRSEAQDQAERVLPNGPMSGPVKVYLTFGLQRPASAPKRKRTWPIGARSGDVDKLARSILDALTGVLFADDSQVLKLTVEKDYGTPGVEVRVYDARPLSEQVAS